MLCQEQQHIVKADSCMHVVPDVRDRPLLDTSRTGLFVTKTACKSELKCSQG